MRKYLVLILLLSSSLAFAQGRVSFVQENIDFKIDSSRFYINGVFYFVNNDVAFKKQNIVFPFGILNDSVSKIRVFDLNKFRSIPFRELEKGIAFTLELAPQDTLKVNIAYQQIAAKENAYFLTCTGSWGQAIGNAYYSLEIADEVKVDSLSYKPDSISGNVAYWTKQDFWPDKQFTVWVE